MVVVDVMLSAHYQIYMCVHDDFSTHSYTVLYLFISYGEGRVRHKGYSPCYRNTVLGQGSHVVRF